MKFREFLRRTIPNSAGSFQQINTSEAFDQALEDSDYLVPNIELVVIESHSQREVNRNLNNGNSRINPTDFNEIVPRGDCGFNVYNSPNVEIPETESDPERLNFHREDNRSRESDPLGLRLQLTNQANNSTRLSRNSFKNKLSKCFSHRVILGIVLGIMAIISLITFTTIQVSLRRRASSRNKNPSLEKEEFSDLNNIDFVLLPDINSLTNIENEHLYKIPKDLDWKLYTISNLTNDSHAFSSHSDLEDTNAPMPTPKPLMPLPVTTLEQKLVPGMIVQESIADVKKLLNSNRTEIKHDILGNHTHHRSNATTGITDQEIMLAERGFTMQETYRGVAHRMNLTKTEASQGLILLNGTVPKSWCVPNSPPKCNITEDYRSFDGSCNNVRHVHWGAANLPFRRILFPQYDDGISSPRTLGMKDFPLPSARTVSREVFVDNVSEDEEVSLMLPIWIQFIYNDLIYTAPSTAASIEDQEEYGGCCNKARHDHPDCFPITLSSDDPIHILHNMNCMSFLRSAPNEDCHLGPREQYNEMSSYLDASNIYGSSLSHSESLRLEEFGLLKSHHSKSGQELLPILQDKDEICNKYNKDNSSEEYCFIAGDRRVNDVTTLTSLHTIWLRQHNRISENLNTLNPHWDDEKLFQETRRIVTAQIQHITYNELLPELLPQDLLARSGLKLDTEGYYKDYDGHVDPTVSNVFGTILKFGNSMLKGLLRMVGGTERNDETRIRIQKLFKNPFLIWRQGAMDSLIRGVSSQPAAKVDTVLPEQLTNLLQSDGKVIEDLIATDIQRSRDHGIRSYLEWRKLCNLPKVGNFNELNSSWEGNALDRISKVYKVIQDVDLYTGMLAEKHILGGKVGPTVACILVDQFVRLKKGDRFWYEGDIQMESFSLEQLQSIRSTTLAKVLCENGDDIKMMQLRAMVKPSPSNSIVSCSKIEKFNYEPWKERKHLHGNHDSLEDYLEANDTNPINFTLPLQSRNNSKVNSQKHGILIPLQSTFESTSNHVQNKSLQLLQFDKINQKGHANETEDHAHVSHS